MSLRPSVRLLVFPAALLALAIGVRLSIAGVFRVPTRSMEPALSPGDHVVATRIRDTAPRRGEIVVFEDDEGRAWIKRLVGLPGDSIVIDGTRVSVNGTTLAEPYALAQSAAERSTHLVPTEHYFVMGDNRENSEDSRSWGFIARDSVVGRAWRICWSRATRGTIRWERIFSRVE